MIGVICEKITLRALRLVLVAAVLPWFTQPAQAYVEKAVIPDRLI
ncbi:hypothetical protein [Caldithrix abyssi]|nr:hypothetical protein [Caldithrix abyssi]